MSRMIFVTTELHPEVSGGAGVAVDALVRGLAREQECVVLLLHPDPVAATERENVDLVSAVIPKAPHFMERSVAAAEALARLVQPGDRVEFQDFEGIAFHALTNRSAYGLKDVAVTVRFHGPYDVLLDGMESRPGELELPGAMEREVFGMADSILIPVEGHGPLLIERYEVEQGRVVVSPPPVPDIGSVDYSPASPPVLAVLGRLGEVKGSQDAVVAALRLLRRGTDLRLRFIGGDGWSPTHGPMRAWLETLAGSHVDAIEFRGSVPRDRLPQELRDVTAVVVPSRFESFCLAAHEARRMGFPVIVPDLEAFRGLLDGETGALVYNGKVTGLARAMRRMVKRPALASELAGRPIPELADPWTAYRDQVAIWHPRSQAGMGTAAGQRLEAFIKKGPPPPKPGLLQRLYRLVPNPVVNLSYEVFPRRLKEALASRASWSAESKRRAEKLEAEKKSREPPPGWTPEVEARLVAVAQGIADGGYPEVAAPEISVVVPVYDNIRYLDETLASVYEQTFDSWEIIVVDDGSTAQEAREYFRALKRPRLRLIRQRNEGLPGARNAGIAAARGKFVIPLDADDQLLPTYMETMVGALESDPSAGYAHCYAILHHDIDAIWVTRPFNPYWQLLGNGVFGCATIRIEAIGEVGGYDTTMTSGNEDWELWLRLMSAGWGQVQVYEPLVKYRKHGVSMSVRTESRFEEGRRSILERHRAMYEALDETKKAWYPMVTVVGRPRDPGNVEIETVAGVEELSRTWGKYVIDLRGTPDVTDDTLLAMAEALESSPKCAYARTAGNPPLTMRRRWNLHDPNAAPEGGLTLDLPDVGGGGDLPEVLERTGWAAPPLEEGEWRPVQRQTPEEDGHLPDISKW